MRFFLQDFIIDEQLTAPILNSTGKPKGKGKAYATNEIPSKNVKTFKSAPSMEDMLCLLKSRSVVPSLRVSFFSTDTSFLWWTWLSICNECLTLPATEPFFSSWAAIVSDINMYSAYLQRDAFASCHCCIFLQSRGSWSPCFVNGTFLITRIGIAVLVLLFCPSLWWPFSFQYYLKARFHFNKDQFADMMVISGIAGTISQVFLTLFSFLWYSL